MKTTTFSSIQDMQSYLNQEVGVSDWMTISQEDIDAFAKLTKDEQWIHVDPERCAKESPFKTTIAHGFHLLSYASYLAESCMTFNGIKMGMNYGFDKIRFVNPVLVNSLIRARFTLHDIQHNLEQSSTRVKWQLTIEVKDSPKPAIVAEWINYFLS